MSNDVWLLETAKSASLVVCCWGANGEFRRRGPAVKEMLRLAGDLVILAQAHGDDAGIGRVLGGTVGRDIKRAGVAEGHVANRIAKIAHHGGVEARRQGQPIGLGGKGRRGQRQHAGSGQGSD